MPLKTASLTTAFIFLSLLITNAQNQKSTDRIAVTAKRMIDVRSGQEISDAVVFVEKNKIAGVGSSLKIPDSVQVIALGDVTLLPGLIDAHTHLLHQYYTRYGDDNSNRLLEMIQLGPAKRALLGVRLAICRHHCCEGKSTDGYWCFGECAFCDERW